VYCRLPQDDVVYFDDTVGLLVFGGTELNPSFQGYIGQAVLYRLKAVSASQVSSLTYMRTRVGCVHVHVFICYYLLT